MKRLSLVGLVLCIMAVFLAGCGKDKFVGQWTAASMTARGMTIKAPAGGGAMDLEIVKEKGKYLLRSMRNPQTMSETLTRKGDNLTFTTSTAPGFPNVTGVLAPGKNKDELTLTMGEGNNAMVILFTRKTK